LNEEIENLQGDIAKLKLQQVPLKKQARSILTAVKNDAIAKLADLNAQIQTKQNELEAKQAVLEKMTAASVSG